MKDEWNDDIEAAPKDGTGIILAVPNGDSSHIVGEAYFDPENPSGGGWWWAGTDYGDNYAEPIHAHHPAPTHWQPLPSPPTSIGADDA